MAVKFSSWGNQQIVNDEGDPAVGWKINTYVVNSSTPLATYTTAAGDVQQSNPIVINALGFPTVGQIWLTEGLTYKLELTDENDVVQKTEDNITGVNDVAVSQDQWVASGLTPTFIGATSFSFAGDQTSTFHPGRRLKTTNSGGTIYSTIIASAFAALTTITVVNDSGTLDAGLSAVSYGLLSATDPSTPLLADTYPIVSGSADKTKKVRLEADGLTTATTRVITMPDRNLTLGVIIGTPVATTTGTAHNFTSIPSGIRAIEMNFQGVSTNGTGNLLLQIGTGSALTTSGYVSTAAVVVDAGATAAADSTAGFLLTAAAGSGSLISGTIVLRLLNSSTNLWVASGSLKNSTTAMNLSGGDVPISGVLDIIGLLNTAGDTFDAGSINIDYFY